MGSSSPSGVSYWAMGKPRPHPMHIKYRSTRSPSLGLVCDVLILRLYGHVFNNIFSTIIYHLLTNRAIIIIGYCKSFHLCIHINKLISIIQCVDYLSNVLLWIEFHQSYVIPIKKIKSNITNGNSKNGNFHIMRYFHWDNVRSVKFL